MAGESQCLNCGYVAPGGGDGWEAVEVPSLGTMTQCPECESTDVHTVG